MYFFFRSCSLYFHPPISICHTVCSFHIIMRNEHTVWYFEIGTTEFQTLPPVPISSTTQFQALPLVPISSTTKFQALPPVPISSTTKFQALPPVPISSTTKFQAFQLHSQTLCINLCPYWAIVSDLKSSYCSWTFNWSYPIIELLCLKLQLIVSKLMHSNIGY